MPTIAGPVDDNGNITVPVEGGVVIPIREQDELGNPIDISAIPMRFFVRGRIEKSVAVDQDEPTGKKLIITETEADNLSSSWLTFTLLDDTDPLVPIPLWTGKIRRAT